MMSSLHLDTEDEPRRGLTANSRANSVRFDESANQNHFSHSTRPSVDLLSRTSSGLGGLRMDERTSSHKSEGRASSAHSIRSLASGRANSLNLDTATYGLGDSNRSPVDGPGFAPGLLLLGTVPAIIRCWMNSNFKHDALLYAAVCTGSHKSYLALRLIQKLGFEGVICTKDNGLRTAKLPIFFPEATRQSASRVLSEGPHVPSLFVEFQVVENIAAEDKSIQIFLGSDVLRTHNADILFSSDRIVLFDDERNKLSIPMTRPEDENAFNGLYVTAGASKMSSDVTKVEDPAKEQPYLNGLGQGSSTASISSAAASPPPGKYRPPGAIAAETGTNDAAKPGATGSDKESRPASQASNMSRPSLSALHTKTEREEALVDTGSGSTPLRSGSSPAIWNNWRRDNNSTSATAPTGGLDWANASRTREASYQRKETGIKVLKKPSTASRTFSTTAASSSSTTTPSPADGRSRFFDDGRRRSITSDALNKPATTKENSTPTSSTAAPKTKSNPIGGASAFSWLNSGGSK